MTKIANLDDFNKITSSITSFSHAYLFDTNSLEKAYSYIKEFAKALICRDLDKDCQDDICEKIDHEVFDDLYIVNPDTISISTSEIQKLLNYMETKSLIKDGKRVYIIYGFERLSRDVSNKILKFLEEPDENIYALLMSENIEGILPTIISRCQVIHLTFELEEKDDYLNEMQAFLNCIVEYRNNAIAYENEFFKELLLNRNEFYNSFLILENIVSQTINYQSKTTYNEKFVNQKISTIKVDNLINILAITNHLKSLVKQNINLNLLLDRYIIEVVKELESCKE